MCACVFYPFFHCRYVFRTVGQRPKGNTRSLTLWRVRGALAADAGAAARAGHAHWGTQHGTWHGTHFSSCCLQLWECVKLVVQTVQENGFSPVCVRLCTVRPLAVVQRALQPT